MAGMAGMDEMERSIRTRSESLGFKFALVLLAAWTLTEMALYLAAGRVCDMLPALVLVSVLLVQGLSEQWMRRRMVAGDEEYREPNRVAQLAVGAVGVALVVFFVGFFALYAA